MLQKKYIFLINYLLFTDSFFEKIYAYEISLPSGSMNSNCLGETKLLKQLEIHR
jgi:hypothetical protein